MMLLWFIGCSSYAPGEKALEALVSDDEVLVTQGEWITFMPRDVDSDVGVIFYPGGLVQPEAYAAPVRRFAEAGIPAHILPMPADLAIFGIQRGEWLLDAYPEVAEWLLVGHSLGAVAAASFAASHAEHIAALSMWAGYPAGNIDLQSADFPVLMMVGAQDGVINWEQFEASATQLPTHTSWLQIGGANHAQFGDYGHQEGDLDARISPQAQWAFATERTLDLIE